MAKILLVDDESSIVWAFRRLVSGMGHKFFSAATAEEGVNLAAREGPDLIFMDVRLPGKDGLWAVGEIRKKNPSARIVVLTAHGTLETALRSMQLGAVEYLPKPLDVDRTRGLIDGILGSPKGAAPDPVAADATGIIGRSPVMQEVFRKVAAASQSDATVLLTGESGTGKELIARAIHRGSHRASGPFEAINCAAIPETLLESELYGHERGAFTGAVRQRRGKFELADGGTAFLDEIGDLSAAAQVKLLRFLEERRFERVGGEEEIKVDVRVIAATHQNLVELVRGGKFREDLYFRLQVVEIELPPLRERRDDIPLLVEHYRRKTGAVGMSEEVLEIFHRYAWPGNIRELRNAIERGSVLARGRVLEREHLPASILSPPSANDMDARVRQVVGELIQALPDSMGALFQKVEERWERALLERVLRDVGWNQVKASERLGINRLTLRRRMRKYGLKE